MYLFSLRRFGKGSNPYGKKKQVEKQNDSWLFMFTVRGSKTLYLFIFNSTGKSVNYLNNNNDNNKNIFFIPPEFLLCKVTTMFNN